MDRHYYMVRAMGSTEQDFHVFLRNNVVAVGWSSVDFAQSIRASENLRAMVSACYYTGRDIAPQVVGRKLMQVQRFCQINKGDYVIVPYYNQILLAIAQGELLYSSQDESKDLANQQKVTYQYQAGEIKRIPRNELSEALQRRLRVRGSIVSDLDAFAAEIETLFLHENFSNENIFMERERLREEEFKVRLLHNICVGQTNLQTGGVGLERLVCELFQLEGYNSEIYSKRTFPGGVDADVKAIKSDRFSETGIVAQVKHHQGTSDIYGLNQVLPLKDMSEYQGYTLAYITTGQFADDVKEAAENHGIYLMDGLDLVDWLFTHLDTLSADTKTRLHISSVPMVE